MHFPSTSSSQSQAGGLYFAYGSNMDVSQMRLRCPACQVEGPGLLRGWRLVFRGNSRVRHGAVATIIPMAEGTVPGLVFRMTPADWEALDRLEGVPNVYRRRKAVVVAPGGIRMVVQTYEWCGSDDLAPVHHAYYDQIERAYGMNDFDLSVLHQARAERTGRLGLP